MACEYFLLFRKDTQAKVDYTTRSVLDSSTAVNILVWEAVMSGVTLGLDVGSASVGWALVDENEGGVLASGVRVFPEGVDRDQQGGEKSKHQARREARGMRRQIARRSRRKKQLRDLLTSSGLLPDNDNIQALLDKNPYALRRRGLDEELALHEFGRVLLHLNQRRGFQSNRKTDKPREKETKGMLAEIGELQKSIADSGSRTLGEYLARLNAKFQQRISDPDTIVRNRHTRRDMYATEFDALWEVQATYSPLTLTDKLRDSIRELIFFQRDMYWPRSVVGRCELEPKEKRCPRAGRVAQRFRLLQEVNNLRVLDPAIRGERNLKDEERRKLIDYLWDGKERSFDQIRKRLKLCGDVRFNLERGERSKLKGNETDAAMSAAKALGKDWKKFDEETKDAVVEILIHESREDEAIRRLLACGLTDEQSERASEVHLPDKYMNFSEVAIRKLLPHLERGLMLMADDATNSALHAAGYLRPDEREVNQQDFLPPAPELTNPLVRQAILEVRKVVNAIIREYGCPDRIHVELAREAKKSFDQRQQIRFDNAKRERKRDEIRARIAEHDSSIKTTRATVNRHLLWQEQNEFCVYCGSKIGVSELFDGSAIDVDHILPRWRSLDNSLMNKVVCHKRCNADKRDRTPYEWLAVSDPERYDQVLRAIECLPYPKHRRFQQKELLLDEFVERQLRDTAYIGRCVKDYLKCLGVIVDCTKGHMTAELRYRWGLNTILNPEGSGEKTRTDHRHHAVDAIVIALTTRKRIHTLAKKRGKDLPMPWPSLREQVETSIADICVSHRAQRGIRGELHEATFYGATQKVSEADRVDAESRPWAKDWIEEDGHVVRRKPIIELKNTKHLGKVRDPAIRAILADHLRCIGVDPDTPGAIHKGVFTAETPPRMPSGVPIKRVRMVERGSTFRPVSNRRNYQTVKPGNNNHIVYRVKGEGPKERWTAKVVTTWDAAQRARSGIELVDRTDNDDGRFVMSLAIGEMFLIDGDDGKRWLCAVQKMDQLAKRINYFLHTDARPKDQIKADNLSMSPTKMQAKHARKVVVDTLGRIRRAND